MNHTVYKARSRSLHARARIARLLAPCLAALTLWAQSAALQAQEIPPAVPEYIVLSEKDMKKPFAPGLMTAHDAFHANLGKDPVRALETANEVVVLTREAYGYSHHHYARALTNLAIVQADGARINESVETFRAAFRAHQRAASRSCPARPSLTCQAPYVNALHGLARVLMTLEQPQDAIKVFTLAQNIIERQIPALLRAPDMGTPQPELITLTEADLETPAGKALASALEVFAQNARTDPTRAAEVAKEIVLLTSAAHGESLDHTSRALTNLAIMQARTGKHDAAIDNYLAAILARERASGSIVDTALVNPLLGLANAHVAVGDIESAVRVFERAIHISQVNEGPFTLDQVEILSALSRTFFLSGDEEMATEMQVAISELLEQRFQIGTVSDDPERFLSALGRRAAWFSGIGAFEASLRDYRRIEQTISDEYGESDVRLIDPLLAFADAAIRSAALSARGLSPVLQATELAEEVYADRPREPDTASGEMSARLPDRPDAAALAFDEGRSAMRRALQIARAQAATDPGLLAYVLVRQGDWFVSLDQSGLALRAYKEAWAILDEAPALRGLRNGLFGSAVPVVPVAFRPIYVQRLTEPVGREDREGYPDLGQADIAFDIDTRGRPVNVRVLSADPAGLMDPHLRSQMRFARFRPAFSNGEARLTPDLTIRHTFHYDASRLTQSERDTMASTTYERAVDTPGAPDRTPARVQ